ncbi:Leucine-rich PPR motif-containing protein, mitochondrial [Trichoplax sp. H2]|nr:Leucine-rich PPR motif-containing protein, mitochondrial [Trichoplax sp. H2]|eukprot:RDD38889.1 Leucine-rich PPR motif-containing protein, mitochondrial [Trichoplax sp. H2]
MWRVSTRFLMQRPVVFNARNQAVSHSLVKNFLSKPQIAPIGASRWLSISRIACNTHAETAQTADPTKKKETATFSYEFLDFDNFLTVKDDQKDPSTTTSRRPPRRPRARPIPRMGEIYSKEILLLDFRRICDLEFISHSLGCDIIRNCGERLRDVKPEQRIELVHQFWAKLASRDYRFNVNHYNELLTVYNFCEHTFSPIEFLSSMRAKNVSPDKTTYINILQAYGIQGDIKAASTILDYMKNEDMSISESVYAALITGHARADDLDNSYATFDLMRQNNIMPSQISYTALVNAVAERGNWLSLEKVFQMMQKDHILPDRHTYSSVIKALSRTKKSFLIPNVLDSIEGKISLFQALRGTMIDLCFEGDFQGALFILKDIVHINPSNRDDNINMTLRSLLRAVARMETETKDKLNFIGDIEHEKLIDHYVWYDFLDVLHDNRNTDLAVDCIREMAQRKIPVRSHFVYPMFIQYRQKGDIEGAVNLLHLMDSCKILGNKITYSIFMSCFGQNRTLNDIVSAIESHNIKVSLSLINAIATHLKSIDDSKIIVEKLLPRMVPEVLEKQSATILSLLKLFNAEGCLNYIKMVNSREDLNSKIYSIIEELVSNFVNTEQTSEAEELVESLLKEGLGKHVTSIVHTRVLSGLCRKMNEAAFFRYGRIMRDHKLSLDKYQYRVVLKMLAKLGKVDLAQKCFDELKAQDGLTSLSYSHLIFAYHGSKNFDQILRIYDEMVEKSVRPISAAIHMIITALQRAGRGDEAAALQSIESESKDIMTMNVYVEAAASQMNIEAALEKLAEVKAAGNTPLPFAYTSLLKAYRNRGDCENAYKLYLEMKDLQVEIPKICFVILIGLFAESRNLDRAKEILDCALAENKVPYVRSFEQMITLAISKNDQDTANAFVKDMRRIFDIDYNEMQEILLASNLAANQVAVADNYYKYLKGENSSRLITRFKAIAKTCVRTNNLEILQTLQEFTKRHHVPLDQSYLNEGLLLVYSNKNDVNQGIELYKNMKNSNAVVSERFTTLLHSLLQRNDMDISEVVD